MGSGRPGGQHAKLLLVTEIINKRFSTHRRFHDLWHLAGQRRFGLHDRRKDF
jgi:hypothetical protein